MMRVTIAVLAAVVTLAFAVAPVAAADKDCSDFPTQRAAQQWFKHHNPKKDPSGLDADHDGIACEDNP
jgi:Excalibur calcium-binding domain